MCEILAFEADRRAFIITINSFGTELTKDDREKLYPTCGKLYPDGLKALARADDYEQVRSVAEYYSVSNFSNFLRILALSNFLYTFKRNMISKHSEKKKFGFFFSHLISNLAIKE